MITEISDMLKAWQARCLWETIGRGMVPPSVRLDGWAGEMRMAVCHREWEQSLAREQTAL